MSVGTADKSAEIVPEEKWREYGCDTLCNKIREMGYEPVPFTGVLHIESEYGKTEANGFHTTKGGRTYIGFSLDDAEWEKTDYHEIMHAEFELFPDMLLETWNNVQNTYGDENKTSTLTAYIVAYKL